MPDGCAGFPFLRWSCLALILIGEITTFGPALHLRVLPGDARAWVPSVLREDEIIDLLVAVLAATALFGWHAFHLEIVNGEARSIGRTDWKRWLAFHFLTLVAIAVWTEAGPRAALDGSAEAGAWGGTQFLGWAVLWSAMIWTWVGAMMSRRMDRIPAAFVIGGIVAVLALRAAMHARSLWQPLQQPTLWAVFTMLGLAGSDPVVDPIAAVVGTRRFTVTIFAPCAGLEGIGLVSVLVATLLWLYRDEYRFPHALLLLPLGIAAVWLLDVLRIVLLIHLGGWRGELAVEGFHSFAGWIALNTVAFGLVVASRRLRWFRRAKSTSGALLDGNPAAPYLLPFLAITATALITHASSGGLDALYPTRVIVGSAVLWSFRRQIENQEWSIHGEAVLIGAGVAALWIASMHREGVTLLDARLGADLAHLPAGWAESWVVLRVLGAVFTVPIAEELAFRGYLLRKLVSVEFEKVLPRDLSSFALIASSIAFGALHERWLTGAAAGLLFSWAFCRHGRLCDAIVAHGTSNGLIAGFVLATGRWSEWS